MYDKITAHYADELRDVLEYANIAKEAENATQKRILLDIANEEHEHATMLRHILEKHGMYKPTEDMKRMEADAKSAIGSF